MMRSVIEALSAVAMLVTLVPEAGAASSATTPPFSVSDVLTYMAKGLRPEQCGGSADCLSTVKKRQHQIVAYRKSYAEGRDREKIMAYPNLNRCIQGRATETDLMFRNICRDSVSLSVCFKNRRNGAQSCGYAEIIAAGREIQLPNLDFRDPSGAGLDPAIVWKPVVCKVGDDDCSIRMGCAIYNCHSDDKCVFETVLSHCGFNDDRPGGVVSSR